MSGWRKAWPGLYLDNAQVVCGDALEVLHDLGDGTVHCVVTDPPYSLGILDRKWDSHNDHEDAAFAYWLTGFVDGEGCFRVQRHQRGTFACTFTIKVRRDERGTLERIRRALGGIGTIQDGSGSGNAHPQSTYAVQDKEGCLRLVRLFDKYPLRAKKRLDYEPWAEAVVEWNSMVRGNRWHGQSDWSRMAALKGKVEEARKYADPPWSGHAYQDWCRQWAAECLRILKPGGHMAVFGHPRTFHRLTCAIEDAGFEIRDCLMWLFGNGMPKHQNLKPAYEPIILARKPPRTDDLNIDAARLPSGRWPNNVALDDQAAVELDRQSGKTNGRKPGSAKRTGKRHDEDTWKRSGFNAQTGPEYSDSGGASRFMYTAKASKAERPVVDGVSHATVKPLALMRWLVRMVTPPDGIVLDPFVGSGTTLEACALEGFRSVGIESEATYIPLVEERLRRVDGSGQVGEPGDR